MATLPGEWYEDVTDESNHPSHLIIVIVIKTKLEYRTRLVPRASRGILD
jgi:hypothetical protein